MAGSCDKVLITQLLLASLNLITLLIGCNVIYFGVEMWKINDDIQDMEESLCTVALILIVFGAAIILVGIIGFVGICFQSTTFLFIYAAFLLLLLIANTAGLSFDCRAEVNEKLSAGITKGFQNFGKDNQTKLAYALQTVQKTFECCGWNGPADYSTEHSNQSYSVPISCCKKTVYSDDPLRVCTNDAVFNSGYKEGCKDSEFLTSLTSNITTTSRVLLVIHLAIFFMACFLTCCARSQIN